MIRILIVDDHAVVRSGLSKFLLVHDDLELVGEAADGEEAVQLAGTCRPDVILMDLMMPGTDGIAAIRAIAHKYPHIKMIALTSFAEQNMVQGALQAGAVGYLQKNITSSELASAIRSANSGRMPLSQEAVNILAESVSQPHLPGGGLTERELEVLASMVEGTSNSEIAAKLVISQGTVKFHVSNIFQKLDAKNRVDAVKKAIEQKLV